MSTSTPPDPFEQTLSRLAAGEISEGQAAKALGVHRVAVRALADYREQAQSAQQDAAQEDLSRLSSLVQMLPHLPERPTPYGWPEAFAAVAQLAASIPVDEPREMRIREGYDEQLARLRKDKADLEAQVDYLSDERAAEEAERQRMRAEHAEAQLARLTGDQMLLPLHQVVMDATGWGTPGVPRARKVVTAVMDKLRAMLREPAEPPPYAGYLQAHNEAVRDGKEDLCWQVMEWLGVPLTEEDEPEEDDVKRAIDKLRARSAARGAGESTP